MIPQRPYLFRAMYDWLLDNQWTPHVLVNATAKGVQVPQQFVKDNKIVLNLNPSAIQDYFQDNEVLAFSARFSGQAQQIVIPLPALEAIYASENGQGMVFPDETFDGLAAAADEPARPKSISTPKAAPAITGRNQKRSTAPASPC